MFTFLLLGLTQSLVPLGDRTALSVEPLLAGTQTVAVLQPAEEPRQTGFIIMAPAGTEQGNEVRRAHDGLFYVTAIVNGVAVRFVVDTGATVVVLTPDDARRAGLSVDEQDFSQQASTANGRASMARVQLDEVVVGTRRAEAVDAAVVGQGLSVSLLGQSLLSRLQSVTIRGDSMLLN